MENKTLSILKKQIKENEIANTKTNEYYLELFKNAIKKEQEYRKLQAQFREDKVSMQSQYKKSLDSQQEFKKLNRSTDISITKNYNSTFDKYDSLHAMIPGLTNIPSIGTRPIYHSGVQISTTAKPAARSIEEYTPPMNVYNPITNPIPVITLNPYILKQFRKK
jgi:hypothetical protein